MKAMPMLVATLIAMTPLQAIAAAACSTALTTDQAVALQERLFDAAGHEDRSAWDVIVTTDFKAFERGKPYTRDSFLQLVVDAHKSGAKIRWSVTDPQVATDCDLAVMSYVNVGSISLNGAAPSPVRWLETAAYRRAPEGWRVFLVTSERTPDGAAAAGASSGQR